MSASAALFSDGQYLAASCEVAGVDGSRLLLHVRCSGFVLLVLCALREIQRRERFLLSGFELQELCVGAGLPWLGRVGENSADSVQENRLSNRLEQSAGLFAIRYLPIE